MSSRIFCVGISLIMAGLLCSSSADASNVSKGSPAKTEAKTTSVQDAETTTSQTEVTETTTTTGASIAVTETTQRSSTGTRVSTTTAGPTTTTYTPRPKNPPALSETQKAKIKEDWISNSELQLTADEVKIRYYGTYNGYMALLIIYDYDGEAPDCPEQYNIEEYTFTRGLGAYFCLYRNSTFIDLQRAYESGLITEQDVRDIHYYATDARGISSTMPD